VAGASELRHHRAWCQGDALTNVLLEEGLARDSEFEQETLVAETRPRVGEGHRLRRPGGTVRLRSSDVHVASPPYPGRSARLR
jgi:hypothetical protein